MGRELLTAANGELLGTATETFANAINLSTSGSTTTFAAATGTTLDVTGAITYAGDNFVDIGAPGQDGEVLWGASPLGSNVGDTFDVLDGTLTAANSDLGVTLNVITGTTVAAGATLDWAGNYASIDNLQGAGTVTNSGAAQTMNLPGDANFSGTISGALSLDFVGNASLSGLEDYTGGATLQGSATVANSGTYDMVRPSEPPDGELDASECDEGREGISEALVVLGQATVSAEPRKGPFDNPAARQDDES